jgi:hypothetical protein
MVRVCSASYRCFEFVIGEELSVVKCALDLPDLNMSFWAGQFLTSWPPDLLKGQDYFLPQPSKFSNHSYSSIPCYKKCAVAEIVLWQTHTAHTAWKYWYPMIHKGNVLWKLFVRWQFVNWKWNSHYFICNSRRAYECKLLVVVNIKFVKWKIHTN